MWQPVPERETFLASIPEKAVMSLQERSDLVLILARVLHVNGQSTDETVAAAERLGHKLDLRARIIPRWGELQLQAEDRGPDWSVSRRPIPRVLIWIV